MTDNNKPDELLDETDPLEALPEDLGLDDEIRQISRKVNRIMKRVEAANAAVRAIIIQDTEAKATEDKAEPPSKDSPEDSPESV